MKFKTIHNHRTDHISVIRDETRKDIKNEIKNSKDPFSVKIPKVVKNISVVRGIKAPSFISIETSLYNELNKNLPKDMLNLANAPETSLYYKTLHDEDFVIYKDRRIVILQSPSLAKIQLELRTTIFCDATFFICPNFAHQIFITRVYSKKTNSYYTTSFSIMTGKNIEDYSKIFSELDKNIKKYSKIGETYEIKEIHTDFESDISQACKKIYPNVIIKNCIWHMLRATEIKKNQLCL